MLNDWSHKVRAIFKKYCPANIKKILPSSQSAWNTRFYFGHQKLCMDNNDDISHFSTIPASFAIKSNVYFLTHQYLIINNNQSQRALSVSVRTVLWIYFASRRNCGLLPLIRTSNLSSGATTRADSLGKRLLIRISFRHASILSFPLYNEKIKESLRI